MGNPFLSGGIWVFRVSVFAVFSSVFLSANFSVFITQVEEAKTIFRGGKILGYASQMDEEQLSDSNLAMDHLGSCFAQ